MEIPGRPAKLSGTVKISIKYIFNGSFAIEPNLYAGVGATGAKITSTFLKAFPKNFILETYLEKPFGFYNGLSGITETVVLTRPDVDRIMNILQNIKGEKNRLID